MADVTDTQVPTCGHQAGPHIVAWTPAHPRPFVAPVRIAARRRSAWPTTFKVLHTACGFLAKFLRSVAFRLIPNSHRVSCMLPYAI